MKSKPFYKSKVFWFNGLFLLVAVASLFGFSSYEPEPMWMEIVGVVVAAVNIVLRLMISTKIG